MSKAFLASLGGALCLALVQGCMGPSATELSAKDNGGTVSLDVGDSLVLKLEGNPTTGYLWTFGAPYDENVLILTGEDYSKPEGGEKRVGAPSTKIMTFKAVGPGRTGVKLDYRRPWEKNERPIRTFETLVVVEGEAPEAPKPPEDETPRRGSSGQVAKPPKSLLK